jgi:hypothetical protein
VDLVRRSEFFTPTQKSKLFSDNLLKLLPQISRIAQILTV